MPFFLDDAALIIVHSLICTAAVPLTLFIGLPIFLLIYYTFLRSKLSSVPSTRAAPFDISGATYVTFYFEASDGVRLAVDLWLPQQNDVKSSNDYDVNGNSDAAGSGDAADTNGSRLYADEEGRDGAASNGATDRNAGRWKPVPTMVASARYWRRYFNNTCTVSCQRCLL
jgi:hypothetical protein